MLAQQLPVCVNVTVSFVFYLALQLLMKQAARPTSPLKGHDRTVQYLQYLGIYIDRTVQYLQHLDIYICEACNSQNDVTRKGLIILLQLTVTQLEL